MAAGTAVRHAKSKGPRADQGAAPRPPTDRAEARRFRAYGKRPPGPCEARVMAHGIVIRARSGPGSKTVVKAKKTKQVPAAPKTGPRPAAKASAREKAFHRNPRQRELPPIDTEARRARLKNLIILGKERSYLTYSEINDHLPDDMLDSEQLESIVGMINDMGIQVCDEAPDAETLLMTEAPAAAPDEQAAAEAEAALSTVDSELGRTTDPVRMYLREMGTVDLLTRQAEVEIAKRIEDGLRHMMGAISACPTAIAEILALLEKVERGEIAADDVIDGLVDAETGRAPAT